MTQFSTLKNDFILRKNINQRKNAKFVEHLPQY